MENNNFVDNLRQMLASYSGPKEGDRGYSKYAEAKRDLNDARFYRQTSGALTTTLQNIGTGIAIDSLLSGNPVIGAIGGTIGGLQALGTGYALLKGEEAYTKRRKAGNKKLADALIESWTDQKNEAIKKASKGKYDVTALAKQGKMVDDDGNIIDIDYDYYSTVPFQTLERVFGAEGAGDVRRVIEDRRNAPIIDVIPGQIERIDTRNR